MAVNTVNKQTLYLGIDGGGSKCKAVITDADHNVLGSAISGPANPLHGYEQTINSITESAKLALVDAGLPATKLSELVAGIGLAGVNLPSLMTKMEQWQHPFEQMFLTTDLSIACLGAHNGDDGAIMITGTGSCGYSYVKQQEFFIGGHGFPHGDKGSGAWTGLQVVTKVLRSLDGLEVDSLMNQQLLNMLTCNDCMEVIEVVAHKPASFFAKLACVAFDNAKKDDELALSIVQDGANYISDIASRLWQNGPLSMSLIGGLTPVITPYLNSEIAQRLSPPQHPPEIGAIIYAKQQLSLAAQEQVG